jgi:hypothetical protein
VTAFQVGADLDFIDCEKRDVEVARHGLHGGDPEARIGWLDLLLAGDEGNRVRADLVDDLLVDLAREQAERQPDHAGRMGDHALDREMRLAGIGRSQDRGDADTAGAGIAIVGRGE